MTLPNVVLAGAPKCGTTSLFVWLSAHPQVCGSTVKETRFLFDEGARRLPAHSNIHKHGIAAYQEYFAHCDPAQSKVVLEGTPGYLYQRTAPRVLATFDPVPHILFLLRKPSDRVYSVYHSVRFRGFIDPGLTFAEYVQRLVAGDVDPRVDDAVERSQYVDYLATWLELFPASKISVLLFEDLRHDPQLFMKALADQLQIEPRFYDSYEFAHEMPTREIRRPGLHRMMAKVASRLSRDPDSKVRTLLRRMAGRTYASLNVSDLAPTKTDEDQKVLEQLDRHFVPYTTRLSRLLDIDLSAWLASS